MEKINLKLPSSMSSFDYGRQVISDVENLGNKNNLP